LSGYLLWAVFLQSRANSWATFFYATSYVDNFVIIIMGWATFWAIFSKKTLLVTQSAFYKIFVENL
jgi:hypothetical protein